MPTKNYMTDCHILNYIDTCCTLGLKYKLEFAFSRGPVSVLGAACYLSPPKDLQEQRHKDAEHQELFYTTFKCEPFCVLTHKRAKNNMSTGVYPAPRINNCCFCEQHTFQRNSPLWGREKMSLVVTNSSSDSLKAGETSARFSLSTSGPRTRSQHHETEHPERIRSLRVSFQCVNKQYRWCWPLRGPLL